VDVVQHRVEEGHRAPGHRTDIDRLVARTGHEGVDVGGAQRPGFDISGHQNGGLVGASGEQRREKIVQGGHSEIRGQG
jgi:hypothetical protein